MARKVGRRSARPERIFNRAEVVQLRESGLSIEKIPARWGLALGQSLE
jgi:hypothetical protein